MAIAESSREPGYGEDVPPGGVPYHPLAHSNSTSSFASSSVSSSGASASGHSRHSSQRTQL